MSPSPRNPWNLFLKGHPRFMVGAVLGTVTLFSGCSKQASQPTPPRTVFEHALSGALPQEAKGLEVPFPPKDRRVGPNGLPWVGVSVLREGVRFSRPPQWRLRDGSSEPGRAYVRYITPDGYSFALYERTDSPEDLWRDILLRFEEDVAMAGAKVVGGRVPVATFFNQGRAYTIERTAPSPSLSREVLLRSDHRVVLLQAVTQGPDFSPQREELLEVLNQVEVL